MDWSTVPTDLIHSLVIVALAGLGLILVYVFSKRALSRVASLKRMREARRQQLVTLVRALRWVASVVILGIALMMLLSSLGVNIAPLLASAGVAGLAISFGAQSLIKDFIGGVLILAENQYAVGDTIQIGTVSGQVEDITLRATHVRAVNGSLYIVPNGEVRIIANQTRDWSRALVDIGVAYEEDLDHVLHVLEESAAAFAQDPAFAPDLVEQPQVLGPLSLGDWAVTVRLMVKTQPGKHLLIARELRKAVIAVCEREGISLPYPRQEVWLRGAADTGDLTGSDG